MPSLLLAPSRDAQPPRRLPSPLAHTAAGCKAEFYRQGCFEEPGLLAATVLTSVRCFHHNLLKAGPIPALPACTREGGNNPPPLQLQRIGAFNWKEKLSHPSPSVTGLSLSKGFALGLRSGEFHNGFKFAKTDGASLAAAATARPCAPWGHVPHQNPCHLLVLCPGMGPAPGPWCLPSPSCALHRLAPRWLNRLVCSTTQTSMRAAAKEQSEQT